MLKTMRAVAIRHYETGPGEMQMCMLHLYELVICFSGYPENCGRSSLTDRNPCHNRAITLSRRDGNLVVS
jgi:hypothetical protein